MCVCVGGGGGCLQVCLVRDIMLGKRNAFRAVG